MLVVVGLSCTCTLITVISMSAIATNGKIKRGGAYYMISRSLGPAFGGSVGVLFFLANAFGMAMYILGSVEALMSWSGVSFGSEAVTIRVLGVMFWFVCVFLNAIGLKYVAKTGIVFLSIVLLGILCMYVGIWTSSVRSIDVKGIDGFSGTNLSDNFGPGFKDLTFFTVIGIFFPSCTGIMAGANRSADLQTPEKSIPFGTLVGQIFTSIVYLSFPIFFGASGQRSALVNEDIVLLLDLCCRSVLPPQSRRFICNYSFIFRSGFIIVCLSS
jgi:amino acid transporter